MKALNFLILISLSFISIFEKPSIKTNVQFSSNTKANTSLVLYDDSMFFMTAQNVFHCGEKVTYGKWSKISESRIVLNTEWKPYNLSKTNKRDIYSIGSCSFELKEVTVQFQRKNKLKIFYDNTEDGFEILYPQDTISQGIVKLRTYYNDL